MYRGRQLAANIEFDNAINAIKSMVAGLYLARMRLISAQISCDTAAGLLASGHNDLVARHLSDIGDEALAVCDAVSKLKMVVEAMDKP